MKTLYPLTEQLNVGHGDYKVLQESRDRSTGQWSCTIETPLQKLDEINNNTRVYSTSLMKPVIDAVQPIVLERHLVGEYGHPVFEAGAMNDGNGYIRRITTIDPKLMSHMITKLWIDGNYVMGHIKTLHTHYGKDMTNFIVLDKGTIGFSLRAIGNTKPKNGVEYVVPEQFVFVTYDAVINPSNPIAKFNPSANPMINNPLIESTDISGMISRDQKIEVKNGAICVNGVCMLQESLTNPNMQQTARVTAMRSSLLESLEALKYKI